MTTRLCLLFRRRTDAYVSGFKAYALGGQAGYCSVRLKSAFDLRPLFPDSVGNDFSGLNRSFRPDIYEVSKGVWPISAEVVSRIIKNSVFVNDGVHQECSAATCANRSIGQTQSVHQNIQCRFEQRRLGSDFFQRCTMNWGRSPDEGGFIVNDQSLRNGAQYLMSRFGALLESSVCRRLHSDIDCHRCDQGCDSRGDRRNCVPIDWRTRRSKTHFTHGSLLADERSVTGSLKKFNSSRLGGYKDKAQVKISDRPHRRRASAASDRPMPGYGGYRI